MSKSHRKALKLLLVLALFEENKYITGIRETVFEIINIYQKEGGKVTNSEYKEITGYGKVVDAKLEDLNYKTTPEFLSYLIMAICEHFSQNTRNQKMLKWIELQKMVMLPYTSVEQADRAAEVAEILIKEA